VPSFNVALIGRSATFSPISGRVRTLLT
jgi:hypothetical protein